MRTVEMKVYSFRELSPKAKERARIREQELHGYPFESEAVASIEALVKHFGCQIEDSSYDFFGGTYEYMNFSSNREEPLTEGEIRAKLEELGSYDKHTLCGFGDCKLTGYCADEDAIDGFRIALLRDGKTAIGFLLNAAFRSWLKACQHDCAASYHDNNLAETFDANGIEFTADGEIYTEDR